MTIAELNCIFEPTGKEFVIPYFESYEVRRGGEIALFGPQVHKATGVKFAWTKNECEKRGERWRRGIGGLPATECGKLNDDGQSGFMARHLLKLKWEKRA